MNVGFLWSTLSGYVPPLVAAAAERCPEIELGVCQLAFLEVSPALRRGDVDLVFARPLWAEHEMVESVLAAEPALLAMPVGHPLAVEERIALRQLSGLEMIVFQRSLVPTAYDTLLALAREAGVEPRIVRHARSASEALALVSAGIGTYRIPASAAPPFDGVVYREIADSPSRVTLIHRPLPGSALTRVIELAREIFATESADHGPLGDRLRVSASSDALGA